MTAENVGNSSVGNPGRSANIANIAVTDLERTVAASVGKATKIAKSGWRVEIHKRTLKDGTISVHGIYRERGKGREYRGYISTKEIKGFREYAAYSSRRYTR